MKQKIVDEIMDSFVNSYSTGTMWGQHGVKLDLDKNVRRHLEMLYDKLTEHKHIWRDAPRDGARSEIVQWCTGCDAVKDSDGGIIGGAN